MEKGQYNTQGIQIKNKLLLKVFKRSLWNQYIPFCAIFPRFFKIVHSALLSIGSQIKYRQKTLDFFFVFQRYFTYFLAVLARNYDTCEQLIQHVHDPRHDKLPSGAELGGGFDIFRPKCFFIVYRRTTMAQITNVP